jgi:hypothetical protein
MQTAGLIAGAGLTVAGAAATFGGSAAVQAAIEGTKTAAEGATAAGRIANDLAGAGGFAPTISHHKGNIYAPYAAQAAFNSHSSKAQTSTPPPLPTTKSV